MKYFSIKELSYSDTATAKHIANEPNEEQRKHLTELIEHLLDPLREAWGKPIRVTSGFRSAKLNATLGGSKTSAHLLGYAADIQPIGESIADFKEFVKDWLKVSRVHYDQYIDERSAVSEWVHLGIRNGKGEQRKQNLKYRNGKYYAV